jgi:uncharacterized protein YjbI with pentapeptide repeats
MRKRLAAGLLLLTACSPSTVIATSTMVTTDQETTRQTATTTSPAIVDVGAGVIWEVSDLTELGQLTSAWARSLDDVAVIGDRLIAVGRDGGDGLVLLSDDQGRSWRRAQVEPAPGAESSILEALAVKDGVLIAVGEARSSCPDPSGLCDRSLGAVWRSDDMGQNWSVVVAPTVAVEPSSFLVDVAATSEGFVAIGNVHGPSPAPALLWTSPDGLVWSGGIPLSPSNGGFSNADQLVVTAGTTLITGSEALCGDWYDNGFWVITAGFVRQGRIWSFDGDSAATVDPEQIGLTQPPIPDCSTDEALLEGKKFGSAFGAAGIVDGAAAIVLPGLGVAMEDATSGGFGLEELDQADGEDLRFVNGADLLVGARPGVRDLMELRSWTHSVGWNAQPVGLPVIGTAMESLMSVVATGDSFVAVGSRYAGIFEGVIWRSSPGQLVEGAELSCDPAPQADCRGVDLSETDLSDRDLTGIDLRNADLSGADLSGADLTGARFTSAELRGIDLSGALLVGANLSGADLGSYGDGLVNITGADFTGADLRGAHVDLGGPAVFDEVLADGTFFAVLGRVTGASFQDASLVGAFFTIHGDSSEAALEANFDGADLSLSYYNVDTSGSSFSGTAMSDVNFGDEALCPDGSTPWNEAYGLNRCNLGG